VTAIGELVSEPMGVWCDIEDRDTFEKFYTLLAATNAPVYDKNLLKNLYLL
jgi:hypothetical protein